LVRDNGVGLMYNTSTSSFGVFQLLHHVEELEGTGIVLASVKHIIGRHAEGAWAGGYQGKWADFHFSLPRFTENSDG